MKILVSKRAEKSLKTLPLSIRKKTQKQFSILLTNYRHPSLRTRKMGSIDRYEARIDIHYRFTYSLQKDSILILSIGPHDEGLGKK